MMDTDRLFPEGATINAPTPQAIAKERISVIYGALARYLGGDPNKPEETFSFSMQEMVVGTHGLWMHYESMGWLKGEPTSTIKIVSKRILNGAVPKIETLTDSKLEQALSCVFANRIKIEFTPTIEASVCEVLGVDPESINEAPQSAKRLDELDLY